MPTNRRFRVRRRADPISPGLIALMSDEPAPVGDEGAKFFTTPAELSRLWIEHGPTIIVEWIANYPGTRPSCWWRYDAPRWVPDADHAGRWYVADLPEPRRRLGGIGTPCHEVLAHVPSWPLGIPDQWVEAWDADYYNGRAVDIHGVPIGIKFRDRGFAGVPIYPLDPPRFESQAAYLVRHNLLLRGENARLKQIDFADEIVPADLNPED